MRTTKVWTLRERVSHKHAAVCLQDLFCFIFNNHFNNLSLILAQQIGEACEEARQIRGFLIFNCNHPFNLFCSTAVSDAQRHRIATDEADELVEPRKGDFMATSGRLLCQTSTIEFVIAVVALSLMSSFLSLSLLLSLSLVSSLSLLWVN